MPIVQLAAAVGAHKRTAKVAPSEDLHDGLTATSQPEGEAITKALPNSIAELQEDEEGIMGINQGDLLTDHLPDHTQPEAGSAYAIEPSSGAEKITLATALEVRAQPVHICFSRHQVAAPHIAASKDRLIYPTGFATPFCCFHNSCSITEPLSGSSTGSPTCPRTIATMTGGIALTGCVGGDCIDAGVYRGRIALMRGCRVANRHRGCFERRVSTCTKR